jgi:hypothetical protein
MSTQPDPIDPEVIEPEEAETEDTETIIDLSDEDTPETPDASS